MHFRGQAHSWNNRGLHFDKGVRPLIPSLAMSASLALRRLKADKAQQALMHLAAVTVAEKRGWSDFWTGDESWIMWVNPSTGSRMTVGEELPQPVHQTIGATRPMPMVFFNPKRQPFFRNQNISPKRVKSKIS
jgi:hypothetical protein